MINSSIRIIRSYLGVIILLSTLLFGCSTDKKEQARTSTIVRAYLIKEPGADFPFNKRKTSYDDELSRLNYQSLIAYDPSTEDFGPQLAKEVSEPKQLDENTFAYDIILRNGIKWSDGKDFSTNDVLKNFKHTLLKFKQGRGNNLKRAENLDILVDATDSLKFKLICTSCDFSFVIDLLKQPILPPHILYNFSEAKLIEASSYSSLLRMTQEEAKQIVNKSLAEIHSDLPNSKKFISTAPYQITEWNRGKQIILAKNPNYWAAKSNETLLIANPDSIHLLPVNSIETATQMLVNGDLDIVSNINATKLNELKENTPNVDVYTPLQSIITFLYLNTKNPILNDANTRKGLAHAVNVPFFIEKILKGNGQQLHGPYHPIFSFSRLAKHPTPFNLDSAKHYLTLADWTSLNEDGILEKTINGKKVAFEIDYLYPSISEQSAALAALIKDDAKKIGIKINLLGKEYGSLIKDLNSLNFQIVQGALLIPPPPYNPTSLWHTESIKSGKNRAQFGNKASDKIINQIVYTTDKEVREDLYVDLAKQIADEQPLIYLVVPKARIAVNSQFQPLIYGQNMGYYLPAFKRKPLN